MPIESDIFQDTYVGNLAVGLVPASELTATLAESETVRSSSDARALAATEPDCAGAGRTAHNLDLSH